MKLILVVVIGVIGLGTPGTAGFAQVGPGGALISSDVPVVPPGATIGALDSLQGQTAIDETVKALQATFGSRLAPLRVDETHSGLAVGITNRTSADTDAVSALAKQYAISLTAYPALVSETELNELQRLVESAIKPFPASTNYGIGIGEGFQIAGPDNLQLVLSLPSPESATDLTSTASTIARQFAEDLMVAGRPGTLRELLSIVQGEDKLADARDQAPPRGGRWLYNATTGQICTIGFMGTGLFWYAAVSAGHCTGGFRQTGNAIQTMNGTSLGTVLTNDWADYGRDTMSFGAISGYDGLGVITVNSAGSYRTVTGKTYDGGQNHDATMCGVGYGMWVNEGTNEKCGSIKFENYSVTIFGVHYTNLNCVEFHVYGGDSGGSIWGPNGDGTARAAGTTTSAKHTNSGFPFYIDHDYDCYTVLDDVEAGSGVNVII